MDRLVAFGCSNTYGEGLPDCWVDKNGDPVHQGLDYGRITPLLTAALQELITEVETLKAEVAALKGS